MLTNYLAAGWEQGRVISWLFRRTVVRRTGEELPHALFLIAAIALGMSVFIAILYAGDASVRALQRGLDILPGSSILQIRRQEGLIDQARISSWLRRMQTPVAAGGLLEIKGQLSDGSTVTLVGISPGSLTDLPLQLRRLRGNELLVSQELLERRGLESRTEIAVQIQARSVTLPVTAVPRDQWNSGPQVILCSLEALQSLIEKPGHLSALVFQVPAGEARQRLEAELEHMLPFLDSPGERYRLQRPAEVSEEADRLYGAFRMNILILVGLSLIVCVFLVFNATQIRAAARRQEYAVLTTLGVSRWTILGIAVLQLAVIGVFGSFVGATLGRPLSNLVGSLFLGTLSSLYLGSQSTEALGLREFFWVYIAAGVVGVLVTVIGGVWPYWRSAAVAPSLGMKTSHDLVPFSLRFFSGVSAFSFLAFLGCLWMSSHGGRASTAYAAAAVVLVFLAAVAPLVLSLTSAAVRQLAFRVGWIATGLSAASVLSSRSLLSLSVLTGGLALTILIGIGSLISSFRISLGEWVEYSFQADIFIRPRFSGDLQNPNFISPLLLADILSRPGIHSFSRSGSMQIEVNGTSVTFSGSDLAISAARGTLRILEGSLDLRAIESGEGVLASESAARRLHLRVGDLIDIAGRTFRLVGTYKEFSRDQGYLLTDQRIFQEITGESRVESLTVYLNESVSSEKFQRSLSRYEDGLFILQNREIRERVFSIFDQTFAITSVMRAILIVLCIVGFSLTTFLQLYEKRVEFRLFHILGVSPWELSRVLLIEGALVGGSAVLIGIVCGIALGWVLVALVNPAAFGWTLGYTVAVSDIFLPAGWLLLAHVVIALVPLLQLRGVITRTRVVEE